MEVSLAAAAVVSVAVEELPELLQAVIPINSKAGIHLIVLFIMVEICHKVSIVKLIFAPSKQSHMKKTLVLLVGLLLAGSATFAQVHHKPHHPVHHKAHRKAHRKPVHHPHH
jgi:hypothetical protein